MSRITVGVAISPKAAKSEHFQNHRFEDGFRMQVTTQELAFLERLKKQVNMTATSGIVMDLVDYGGTEA